MLRLMRVSWRMGAMMLLSLAGCWAATDPSGVKSEVFWQAGPVKPADRPGHLLYPAGSLFLFSFYSVGGGPNDQEQPLAEEKIQELFRDYAKSGFQIVGPQYGLNSRVLQDGRAHGLRSVYSVGFTKEELKSKDAKAFSPAEIQQQVSEEVAAAAADENLVLWDLRPEELRPWRKREMEYLEAAARAIKAADPLQRPIYHYCPGHFSAQTLRAIAPHVDYLGKGMYTNYSSQKQSRIWVKWSIDQEVEAIRESGAQAVPIAVAEMFQQPAAAELPLVRDWVRHDIYLALVSGAKGVLVFSLRQRKDFDAWSAYYDAYKAVGAQLLGRDGLAEIFLFGAPRQDLRVEVTEGPEIVEMTYPSANVKEPLRYPSLNFADLAYGDKRYLVVVNSANEPVKAVIGGFPYDSTQAQELSESRDHEPFAIGEGEFSVEFHPLEVKIYRFVRK